MKVSFDEENRREDPFKFPKLQLEHGESARILVAEDPIVNFAHTINWPVIGPDGKGVRETRKTRDNKDYETWADEWKGRYLCTGDETVLLEKGLDPDNCPACQAAKDHSWMRVPERRFAMHVVRYELMPDGEPVEPLSVRILGWGFTEGRFDTIVEFKKRWKDLRAHDLTLGPCTNKGYQKFDMQVEPDAIWIRTPENTERVSKAFKSTRYENLPSLNGREVSAERLTEEVTIAGAKWRQVEGDGTTAATPLEQGMVAAATGANFDDLLGGETVAAPEEAPEVTPEPETAPAPTAETPGLEPPTAPAAPAESGKVDFDALLADAMPTEDAPAS